MHYISTIDHFPCVDRAYKQFWSTEITYWVISIHLSGNYGNACLLEPNQKEVVAVGLVFIAAQFRGFSIRFVKLRFLPAATKLSIQESDVCEAGFYTFQEWPFVECDASIRQIVLT